MSEMLAVSSKTYFETLEVLTRYRNHHYYEYPELAILIIHGSADGTVCYNGNDCSFKELSVLIRRDYHIPNDRFLKLKVFCCYGNKQIPYTDELNMIYSAYDNDYELYVNQIQDNYTKYCIFTWYNSLV